MTFMIYGGLTPRVVGCGSTNLTAHGPVEACEAVSLLRNKSNCVPKLEAEFQSLSYEVGDL